MRSSGLIAGAAVLALTGIGASAGPAGADANDPALNGTYLATSNGEWARTNESYHDEPTVRSVWTITSSCITAIDCLGTVSSDQGWTAEITFNSGDHWLVKREIPNWERCADGTAATGQQEFRFYPANSIGKLDPNSTTLVGSDATYGPSGACGWNKVLVIRMPFKLVPLT